MLEWQVDHSQISTTQGCCLVPPLPPALRYHIKVIKTTKELDY
jgi:hypothetical protein